MRTAMTPVAIMMSLLAGGMPLESRASTPALTPEQVTDLYIGTFVNRDMDQAAELLEYLKPAYSGKPAFDLQEYRKVAAVTAEQHEQQASAMAAELPADLRAGGEKALLDYLSALDYAISHAKCKATGHTVEPNDVTRQMGGEESKDDVIAEVSYACEVPTVDEAIVARLHAAGRANDVAKLGRAAADFRTAMQSSSRWTNVTGKGSLYRHGLAGVWNNANPQGWMDPILAGLPSFQTDAEQEQ